MKTIVFSILAFAMSQWAYAGLTCQVLDQPDLDHLDRTSVSLYVSPQKEQLVIFSAHNTKREDYKLKSLKRELQQGLSERRKDRLPRFVRADLKNKAETIQADRERVNYLLTEHLANPFQYVAGEFSSADHDRYLARIETEFFRIVDQ